MEEIKTKKCSKCGKELPMTSDYFHKDKAKCGFKARCRECRTGKVIFNKEKEEYRECKKCKEIFPLTSEYYYKKGDGFAHECKCCRKIRDKNRYENIKQYKQKPTFVENIEKWYRNKDNKFKENWKVEDIKWIYDNYLYITKSELLNHFNNKIKYKTLTNIIYQLGLRKIEKNENWSENDLILLEKYYPIKRRFELIEMFKGRTWEAISGKASKLNIKRSDEIVYLESSESHKGFVPSEETKRKWSRLRKGKNNYNYKGNSHLIIFFRSQLYEWKLDSLKSHDFKCYFLNENNSDLEIHHVYKNFSDIVEETFAKLSLPMLEHIGDYSDEEIENIRKTFVDLHYKYGVGIPMSLYIHKTFHDLYGNKNNTYEQFEEFKDKYNNGELEELLNKNKNINYYKIKDESKKRKNLRIEEVKQIRKRTQNGEKAFDLAKEFNCSNKTIYDIKNNRTWKEVV